MTIRNYVSITFFFFLSRGIIVSQSSREELVLFINKAETDRVGRSRLAMREHEDIFFISFQAAAFPSFSFFSLVQNRESNE